MPRSPHVFNVLAMRSLRALGLPHAAFGQLLGVSGRTSERWAAGTSHPIPAQLAFLAQHMHGKDPALAAELAEAIGQSLESLGLVRAAVAAAAPPAPPPPPAVAPTRLVDIVVCGAADEMNLPPSAVRAALRTAFARARELGLDVAAVEAALTPSTAALATAPAKRPASAKR
jgi:hypothetical protein